MDRRANPPALIRRNGLDREQYLTGIHSLPWLIPFGRKHFIAIRCSEASKAHGLALLFSYRYGLPRRARISFSIIAID
jgi:hypothetical protein